MMNPAPIDETRRALSEYRPADLLAAIGALQLLPTNIVHGVRFEAAALAAVQIPEKASQSTITVAALRRALNEGPLGGEALRGLEDSVDNLFCEAITFYGGSYLVFPGLVEEATFVLRHLFAAIFLKRREAVDPMQTSGYLDRARALALFLLRVSDRIARRANVSRGSEPAGAQGEDIVVPSDRDLGILKQAVTFSESEYEALRSDSRLASEWIDELFLTADEAACVGTDLDENPLYRKPLLRRDHEIVVALPAGLLTALRHTLVSRAIELGHRGVLTESYEDAVWLTVDRMFTFSKMYDVKLPTEIEWPRGWSARCYSLDTDKCAHVLVGCDTLDAFDSLLPFGRWDSEESLQRIQDTIIEVESRLFRLEGGPNEILHLLILQGVGRWWFGGITRDEGVTGHVMLMRASDLETMTLLEGGRPLWLRQFVGVTARFKARTRIFAMSPLDQYSVYRNARSSYYLSDGATPHLVAFTSGGAGEVRRQVARTRDFHGVGRCTTPGVAEVTLLHDDARIPLYAPWPPGGRVEILVELWGYGVWVFAADAVRRSNPLWVLSFEFADMVAYWLWQFEPALKKALDVAVHLYERLCIEIQLKPSENWHTGEPVGDLDQTLEAIPARRGRVVLRLGDGMGQRLAAADNQAEREIMSVVLGGLDQLLGPEAELGATQRKQILDQFAPLGIKKKLLILRSGETTPLLLPASAPARLIQEAEEGIILDEIGVRLESASRGGSVSGAQSFSVIAAVVAGLYEDLHRTAMSIQPDGVLEWILEFHEALLNEQETHKLTIATRRACFPAFGSMTEKLAEEVPPIIRAVTASRFVIELLGARPPIGIRPMSLALYDRMLALSAAIIQWGMYGDIIREGLADGRSELLKSGRLAVDLGGYKEASHALFLGAIASDVERSASRLSHYWRGEAHAGGRPAEEESLDAASRAEFGFSMTELMSCIGALLEGGGENQDVVVEKERDLVERLAAKLSWSEGRVRAALKLFTTEERRDYLLPPDGLEKFEVYPWRFNRELAVLRKPLVRRGRDGESEIIWGMRGTYVAATYLSNLCVSGRLRPKSKEMKDWVSRVRQKDADAFSQSVAAVFGTRPGVTVRTKVSKMGAMRLTRKDGQEIGDIDVLVIDASKHLVLALETKDLLAARTPAEQTRELEKLYRARKGKKAAVEHHRERTEWLRRHLKEVLCTLGIEWNEAWNVESMLVLSNEPISRKLIDPELKTVTLRELERLFPR